MKKLSKQNIEFLEKFTQGSWIINSEGYIEIDGNFDCSSGLKSDQLRLPKIKIKRVSGDFNCSNNNLETLEGCPEEVGGSFRCFSNNLRSLKHSPKKIGSNFDCTRNNLETLGGCTEIIFGNLFCDFNFLKDLKGSPILIGGDFKISNNLIESLIGCPAEIKGSFYCDGNNLKSLDFGPIYVGKVYDCSNNKLQDLMGAPKEISGKFICSNNELQTLKGSPETVIGDFICSNNFLVNLKGSPEKIGSGFNFSNNLVNSLEGLPKMDHENVVCVSNVVSERTLKPLIREVCSGVPFHVALALFWESIDYRDQEHLSIYLDHLKVSEYIFKNFSNDPARISKIYDHLPVHIKSKVIKQISKMTSKGEEFERSLDNISTLAESGLFDDI